jgi:hypothetical protein
MGTFTATTTAMDSGELYALSEAIPYWRADLAAHSGDDVAIAVSLYFSEREC